ncbi:MAG: glycosyltransferase family 2 protein [Candidatus Velthaea sp.]
MFTQQQATSTAAPLDEPLVSVIVCTLNERNHIAALLEGVLEQQGVPGTLEILVADGGSTDGTIEIVAGYADRNVRLLENEHRFAVHGFNLAARAARGRYLAFLGAHARYGPRYLADCLALLQRTGAGNVGGVIEHAGEGTTGRAIALAMSLPLTLGAPKFRNAKRETECESVMGGFLERSLFDRLGGFNETNIVNQDGEFNYRLRKAGYRIVVSPEIRSTYFGRSNPRALWRQYFRYGYYRRWTEVQHPGSVPLRVYAPATLIAVSATCLLTALATNALWPLVPVAAYGAVLIGASVMALRTEEPAVAVQIAPIIATMHAAYGIGWLTGLFRHRRPPTA